ncbi:MAG TPA: dynamin family protein [Candidatus Binataceae bacterium]|nr:dynamin family protein [Candidatus Binataceae bacterium]
MEAREQSIRQAASDDRPCERSESLLALSYAARDLGNHRIARDAQALAERVADKRFFLACLGQFKRGKSSLLNALIGSPVLPTGVVPVTAIVTVLRYGPILNAKVHFENGSRQPIPVGSVGDYVSEECNPANFKGVAAVEVFVPSPLLATGMCFVDTPGIGSVYAGNTAVTKAFVPHIDAAMVVLGADPPISGDEVALLEEIASQVDEMIFVLNKADRLNANECSEAIDFARRAVAQKIGRPPSAIFQISAAEWLDGSGPSRDAPALLAALDRLARESAPKLVERAERRGVGCLSAALLREIENQRGVLTAPVEESRRIAERMREIVADAERSLSDLSHLFKAEQERVSRRCNERREAFLAAAIPAARKEFHEAIVNAAERRGNALHMRATEIAQAMSRRLLNQWLQEERPAAEAAYRESGRRFVTLANDFLRRMADSGDALLADLPRAVSAESGFRVKGRLYFGDHFGFPRQTIFERVANAFRSRRRQVEAIEVKVARYLDTLLLLNSTRILNDFDEIIRESGRRLEAEIRGMLKELRSTAENALARAEATRAAGASAVKSELEHLERLRERIIRASGSQCVGRSAG